MSDTVRITRPNQPSPKDTVRLPRAAKPTGKDTVRISRPAPKPAEQGGATLEDFLKQQKPHVDPPAQ